MRDWKVSYLTALPQMADSMDTRQAPKGRLREDFSVVKPWQWSCQDFLFTAGHSARCMS